MMKHPSIISVIAAGAAVAILFAACGKAPVPPDAPAPQVSPDAPVPPGCGLGGPHDFKADDSKVASFKNYDEWKLYFSKGVPLEEGSQEGVPLEEHLFERSVKSDQQNVANGDTFLKYNYVVSTDDCEIYVAIWTSTESYIQEHLLRPETDGEPKCYSDSVLSRLYVEPLHMINIWPEDKENPTRWSPCWLGEGKKDGILDAMSKHFILVQEPGSQTIKNMVFEENGESTKKRSVAYGGEIVVDLNTCTYTINNGSGTYQPVAHDADLIDGEFPSYLNTIAERIGEKVAVVPAYVQPFEMEKVQFRPAVGQADREIDECVPLN